MLRETILNIFENVWPMLVIICTIIISLRIVWIKKYDTEFFLYKEILALGFIIYIICLFHTVTFQDVGWSNSNFIPFKEMLRYDFGSNLFIRNVLGNVLLFLPYGFFITYLFRFDKIKMPIFLTLVLSITIETTQLMIGRVFDIDDIFLNVCGGVLGYFVFKLFFGVGNHFPKVFKKTWFYNVIVVIIVVVITLYLLNVIKLGGNL
jgi:Glycopeptide antibiotics resistance protein